jgi:hypothetical protein
LAVWRPAQRFTPSSATSQSPAIGAATTPAPSSACATRQHQILPPRRRDDLDADRQPLTVRPHRHGADRQTDEGNRLGEQAEVRTDEHLLPAQHHRLLPDQRGFAGRGRGQDHVDLGEQLEHPLAVPAPEPLRLDYPGARDHGAGEEPVAHVRVEVAGRVRSRSRCSAAPSTVVMSRRPLARGPRGQLDGRGRAERDGDRSTAASASGVAFSRK